ncbi:MAG: hypothetical protein H6553_04580 [Chitinophagales bacterium]|nr:hypothetical protein [Chitinophagales bacterium]
MKHSILILFLFKLMTTSAQTIVDTIDYQPNYEFIAPIKILDDRSADLYYKEANNYFLNNDIIPALALIDKAVKMDNENADYWMLNAWINLRALNKKEAVFAAQKAAILAPNNWKALYCLAYCKQNNNDFVGAVLDYSKVIALQPNNYLAVIGRAEAKTALKNYESAIQDYALAIAIQPFEVKAYISRGILYYKINYMQDAINDLSAAIVKTQDSDLAYFYRGLAYLKLNQAGDACTDFLKANDLGNKEAEDYIKKNCIR